MKIEISINYKTNWGEEVCVVGILPQIGSGDDSQALPMACVNGSEWSVAIDIEKAAMFSYSFLIRSKEKSTIRKEEGVHSLAVKTGRDYSVNNIWLEKLPLYFKTSPFVDCFFTQKYSKIADEKGILLNVHCLEVEKYQAVAVLGESVLGEWNVENAIVLTPTAYGVWQAALPSISEPLEYKLVVVDTRTKAIVRWESGENRVLHPFDRVVDVRVDELSFRNGNYKWKGAGVAIPVFSLRTKNSFGVGEFSDLKEMIDWAALVGMRVVQVLPINDTSMTGTWRDSYPYNAISIYALHPIYLGLLEFPLQNKARMKFFLDEKKKLEKLPVLDYEQALRLKTSYIHELFEEKGDEIALQKEYREFVGANENWLFSYACFCCFRDKKKTANYRDWGKYADYDKAKLEKLIAKDADMALYIKEVYFTQYLLQKQLKEVRRYALRKGVVLKGDVPIGISRDSVEAWVEPHLFNLDTQTGAPPDDFSVEGQNWGFPTYNWDEMSKDGYQWWKKRFQKMAEYFDVYRIDHILGFFRIWEIPLDAVQGLLGYFSPALPLCLDEMRVKGLHLSEERMSRPFITDEVLQIIFGERAEDAASLYLEKTGDDSYCLKEIVDSQRKIERSVHDSDLREGLYSLCANVLFLRDKKLQDKFHPRISAQKTLSYQFLNDDEKRFFDAIYDDFFFYRHTGFWKAEAMKKLPPLVSSTSMLVCGEDLGMIPASVPEVMHNLDILSLEIQRMPKTYGVQFEDLSIIPYESVCASSTHDMPPIRLWWKEDRERAQSYYNNVLKKEGEAPSDCSPELCENIIALHLASPAMLSIHPLQDWLSMDADLRRKNAREEQINIPANPGHYWQYRMHLNLEDLKSAASFNEDVSKIMLKRERVCNENE